MSNRSIWKGPYIKYSFFKQIYNTQQKHLKTTSRSSIILPCFIGKIIEIHNGVAFIPLLIREEMIGYKIGEFVPTRIRHKYIKKKNGSKSKSK